MWLITWPFRLLFGIVKLVGRFAAAVIGLALMIAGGAVTFTIVGAFVGIPLAAVGLALFLRALF